MIHRASTRYVGIFAFTKQRNVMNAHRLMMFKAIFTSIVYYKLQRFTERIHLNHAEPFVEALYCVGYSPLLSLTLGIIL